MLEFSPKRARALLDAFGGDPVAVFRTARTEWRERCPDLRETHLARLADIQKRDFAKEQAAFAKVGAQVVSWNDPRYPSNLKQLPDAPPVLLVRGELIPEDKFSIAIVGSRRASQYGLALARQFAKDLASHGLTIVSGGARGVDTLAHRGALDGGGRTLAYLGCGVDMHCPVSSPPRGIHAPRASGA